MPRPPLKPPIHHLAHNRNHIRHIQRDRTHIKHRPNRRITRQPKQVDRNLQRRINPHSRNWGLRARRDAPPHPRQGEQVVARERKDGAAAGLEAGDGDEVHDGEAGEGEEDGGAAAHGGEEELGDGLAAGAADEVERVAHAEDEDEVEDEADEVGDGGGVGDGFGDDAGGVFGFFGDAEVGLV